MTKMTAQEAAANLANVATHLKILYGTGTIAMTDPAITVEEVEASIATLEAAHG